MSEDPFAKMRENWKKGWEKVQSDWNKNWEKISDGTKKLFTPKKSTQAAKDHSLDEIPGGLPPKLREPLILSETPIPVGSPTPGGTPTSVESPPPVKALFPHDASVPTEGASSAFPSSLDPSSSVSQDATAVALEEISPEKFEADVTDFRHNVNSTIQKWQTQWDAQFAKWQATSKKNNEEFKRKMQETGAKVKTFFEDTNNQMKQNLQKLVS